MKNFIRSRHAVCQFPAPQICQSTARYQEMVMWVPCALRFIMSLPFVRAFFALYLPYHQGELCCLIWGIICWVLSKELLICLWWNRNPRTIVSQLCFKTHLKHPGFVFHHCVKYTFMYVQYCSCSETPSELIKMFRTFFLIPHTFFNWLYRHSGVNIKLNSYSL